MKKILLILPIILLSSMLFATNVSRTIDLRLGFLSPDAAETGLIGGAYWGSQFDDIVELGFSADFYYKNFEKKEEFQVDPSADVEVQRVTLTAEKSLYYFPLKAGIRLNIPFDHVIKPYCGGALGWGLLWEDAYAAATENVSEYDDTKFYSGFNWEVYGGAKYKLGRKSRLFAEAFYNGGEMKRNRDKTEAGITWDEIDMGGLGMRFGIQIDVESW